MHLIVLHNNDIITMLKSWMANSQEKHAKINKG